MDAEAFVERLHTELHGRNDDWLIEHEVCGLPALPEAIATLAESRRTVRVVPNGYLPFWRWTMALNYLLLAIPQSHQLYVRLNKLVNGSYYDRSHREPSYRKLLIATDEDADWLGRYLEELTRSSRGGQDEFDGLEVDTLSLLGLGLADATSARLSWAKELEDHLAHVRQQLDLKAGEIEQATGYAEHLRQQYESLHAEYDREKAHHEAIELYVRQMEDEFAKVEFGLGFHEVAPPLGGLTPPHGGVAPP